MGAPIRVTVWNEFEHEQLDERCKALYPQGMHSVIAGFLRDKYGYQTRTATLQEPEHGLTQEVLADTDVLIWWGHRAHAKVEDAIVERVHKRVIDGMGLICLHSAHFSKLFKKLMGTSCDLRWRAKGEKERLWVVEPGHPIVEGIGPYIELPQTEMYGERFDIPAPDTLVFISWFAGGEVFRSGCCFHRGKGKIFYFRPGHEIFPIFYNEQIQRVIANAAKWAAPVESHEVKYGRIMPPLENIEFAE